MRTLLFVILLSALTTITCAAGDTNGPHYGGKITLSGAVSVDQAIEGYSQHQDEDILIEGQVVKVCQQKGCWMALEAEQGLVRVTFKDYGFFVPENLIGKKVQAQGRMYEETMSVSEARHYAKDAGIPEEEIKKITEPVKEYRFVATAVEELS